MVQLLIAMYIYKSAGEALISLYRVRRQFAPLWTSFTVLKFRYMSNKHIISELCKLISKVKEKKIMLCQ